MAKAELTVTASHTALRSVIAGVIRSAGKLESTADDMGVDRAQLYRQMENGHLTVERLEALDPVDYVRLGRELLEIYGPLVTPKARAKQRLRESHAALDEIEQLLEFIA